MGSLPRVEEFVYQSEPRLKLSRDQSCPNILARPIRCSISILLGLMPRQKAKNSTESAARNISAGTNLDALVAEGVFGWKNVRRREATLYGKRADKLGRMRTAKVPNYSTNPVHAYAIEGRMKELGLLNGYAKELSKITHAKGIPTEWATPEQRCWAAIKTVRNRSRLRVVKR